ncbi:MAG: hypothetical protein K6U74_18330 [Firmicutes bacterium]|nr:hypothetical protein [Bacillota bacterium]
MDDRIKKMNQQLQESFQEIEKITPFLNRMVDAGVINKNERFAYQSEYTYKKWFKDRKGRWVYDEILIVDVRRNRQGEIISVNTGYGFNVKILEDLVEKHVRKIKNFAQHVEKLSNSLQCNSASDSEPPKPKLEILGEEIEVIEVINIDD